MFERICANLRGNREIAGAEVYLVDSTRVGTGAVWRTGQSRQLLMNTVAGQVTVFTDPSVAMVGAIEPGPSLYEWANFLAKVGNFAGLPEEMYLEAGRIGSDTYPTRAFYGHYLRWAFEHIRDRYADRVRAHEITATVTDLRDDTAGLQELSLSTGGPIGALHAVVLAQGHVAVRNSSRPRPLAAAAARAGLHYIAPVNAADADVDQLPERAVVLLRGLGLTFFDYMALLTMGRGGCFKTSGSTGLLEYIPSGREPFIVAGCRRGVPHHARGENQKGVDGRHVPTLLGPRQINELRRRAEESGDVSFRRDVWPLVAREVEAVYYGGLIEERTAPRDLKWFRERYLHAPGETAARAVLCEFGIAPDERWDWAAIADPTRGRRFRDSGEFQDWLLRHLDNDVRNARSGNVCDPVKAALDVLRDLRNEVRLVVDHSGVTGRSYRDDLDGWYTPLNAFLSIGPPAGRIAELAALIRAGVVRVIGPGMRVRVDPDSGRYLAESAMVHGSQVAGHALIDAWLPGPDLRITADPLLGNLIRRQEIRTYVIRNPDGTSYSTGGLEVVRHSHAVLDGAGRPHPRRYAFGVPTEAVHWVTAAGPRPGVNSVTLSDSDSIAVSIIAAARPHAVTERFESHDH